MLPLDTLQRDEENRKHCRFRVKLPAQFEIIFGKDDKKFSDRIEAQVNDISSGGVFLETPALRSRFLNALAHSDFKLNLEFELPGTEARHQTFGSVRWIGKVSGPSEEPSERYGMGVSFSEPREELLSYLKQYGVLEDKSLPLTRKNVVDKAELIK